MREAMGPFGAALKAYFEGDTAAEFILRRDDGLEFPLPAVHFFRALTPVEAQALGLCTGRVLDVGAGTGLHSLLLQQKGLEVTAIDICPEAVEIMQRRGVRDARCVDIFEFDTSPFDTLLLLGHGIGMTETLAGLDRFLRHAQCGQILLDSLDVRAAGDPRHLAYHEANRRAGRYIGQTRLQVEYAGEKGPWYGWLHVDAETLAVRAAAAGWACEAVTNAESGEWLARILRRRS